MNFYLPTVSTEPLTLSVVSPSNSPLVKKINEELIENARLQARHANIELQFMPYWDADWHGYAGTPEQRKADLLEALVNTTSGVMSSVGGYTSISVLSPDIILAAEKSSKWVMGMSDMTTILNAITFSTGLITIYGVDLAWGFGKYLRSEWLDVLTTIVLEKNLNSLQTYSLMPLQRQDNSIEGRIMGGCLSSFMSLVGTKYDPLKKIDEDFIFVLEDINIDIRVVEDKLYQLHQIDNYNKYCKALIVGNFLNKEENSNKILQKRIIDILKNTKVSVYSSEYIGHGVANIPLPIGAKAVLNESSDRVNWNLST